MKVSPDGRDTWDIRDYPDGSREEIVHYYEEEGWEFHRYTIWTDADGNVREEYYDSRTDETTEYQYNADGSEVLGEYVDEDGTTVREYVDAAGSYVIEYTDANGYSWSDRWTVEGLFETEYFDESTGTLVSETWYLQSTMPMATSSTAPKMSGAM